MGLVTKPSEEEPVKIAMVGCGGIGGYYGGLLARAGHEVVFIARGANLGALRQKGLTVYSGHGDFSVAPVRATDSPAEAGIADLALVCVKTPATEAAALAMRPMIGPQTVVMSLQNGVDAAARLGAVVGMEHVIGGVTYISAVLEAPGVIRQVSQFRRIVLGEMDGRVTARVQRISEALGRMGIAIEATDNIRKVLWTKFVFIAGFSGIGTLTRMALGDFRAVPGTRALLVSLMQEVSALAHASGVALEADVIAQTLGLMDGAAAAMKPSMQRDVEAGRPSELESMIGVITRLGRERGVPTPVADLVYAALLPAELKAGRPDV
jgi:2-dehydropantoate 2-reductase